jgi:very-short-patch-repair endonuclease
MQHYDIKQTQRNNLKYRNELRQRATKSEIKFKKILDENQIKYIFQKGFLKPFHRIVDFYIPRKKLIIEIDGGYHKEPYYKEKDRIKDAVFLKVRGLKTVRLTNEQVDNYIL